MLPLTAAAGAAVPSGEDEDVDDTLKASANAVPDKVAKAHSDTTTNDLFTIHS
jgi:hypothetical protein